MTLTQKKNSNNKMKKVILCLLPVILFLAASNYAEIKNDSSKRSYKNVSAVNLPKYFYKRFEGTIGGKYRIVMNLTRRDTMVDGNYYYEKKGIPIFFTFNSRIYNDGSIYLGEETGKYDTAYMPIVSGEFKGKFVNEHEIKGYWDKPGLKAKLDFSLEEKYPAGSAALDIKRFSKHFINGDERADIEFMYPIVTNLHDKATEKIINSSFEKTFLRDYNFGDRDINWKSYDEMMNDFISHYKEFVSDTSLPKDYKPMWENSFFTDVIFNSDNILTVEDIEFRFEGGAHPLTFFIYSNYNIVNGKEISLDDLLIPGYKAELDKIGEKRFRETYNIKQGESFEQAGYFIKKNEFHLNNNFSITKTGLRFRFGQYEIGPYVLGAPSVFIPYSEIKDLIKSDGLLANLVKEKN